MPTQDQHDAIMREFRRNGPGGYSACDHCSELMICRAALKTGKRFACMPQEQNADDLIPRREQDDYVQLLADHAPGGYHKPKKREIITGA